MSAILYMYHAMSSAFLDLPQHNNWADDQSAPARSPSPPAAMPGKRSRHRSTSATHSGKRVRRRQAGHRVVVHHRHPPHDHRRRRFGPLRDLGGDRRRREGLGLSTAPTLWPAGSGGDGRRRRAGGRHAGAPGPAGGWGGAATALPLWRRRLAAAGQGRPRRRTPSADRGARPFAQGCHRATCRMLGAEKTIGQVYNMSGTRAWTWREYNELVMAAAGRRVDIVNVAYADLLAFDPTHFRSASYFLKQHLRRGQAAARSCCISLPAHCCLHVLPVEQLAVTSVAGRRCARRCARGIGAPTRQTAATRKIGIIWPVWPVPGG
eukprot:SAG22_NODE_775_length_7293_cov_2.039199_1_plen_321_part_00